MLADLAVAGLFFLIGLCSYRAINLGSASSIFSSALIIPVYLFFSAFVLVGAVAALFTPHPVFVRRSSLKWLDRFVALPMVGVIVFIWMGDNSGTESWFTVGRRDAFEGWGVPSLRLGSEWNLVPYALAATALIPSAIVVILAVAGLVAEVMARQLRAAAVYYLTVVSNMPQRTFLLVSGTPLAAGEALGLFVYGH